MSREGRQEEAAAHSQSYGKRTSHDTRSAAARRHSATHPTTTTSSSTAASPHRDDTASSSHSHSRKRRRRHSVRSSTPTVTAIPSTSSPPSTSHTHRTDHQRPARLSQPRPSTASAASSDSDSDDFLLTAAERTQRRLQRLTGDDAKQATRDAPAAAQPVRHIAGYHYERSTGKYFRIAVGHEYGAERREERLRRSDERKRREQAEERKEGQQARSRRHGARHATAAALFPTACFVPPSLAAPAPLPALLFQRSAIPDRLTATQSAIRSSLLACLSPASLFSPTSSLSSLPISAECCVAFDCHSSSLSVCGAVVEQQAEREDGEAGRISALRASGSYHSVYVLERRERQDERYDDELERKDGEEWRDSGLEARLVHRHETPSPITSSHILTAASTSLTPAASTTPPSQHRPRNSVFYPSPYIPPTSPSYATFLLETLLGSSSSPGSFKLLHCDGHVRSACILPRSSAFCSAPHPLFGSGEARVVVGGGRHVMVFDCEGEQRRWLSTGSKSDQMSVLWRNTDEVYSGGRNGAITLFDLRRSSADTLALPTTAHQPGAITLLQRLPATPYLLLATTTTLTLLDERRWTQSTRLPVVAHYAEHRSEYGCGRAGVTADGRHVMAADDRGSVRVWEAVTGRCLRELVDVRPRSLLASVAADGDGVGGGSGGGVQHTVWLDDLETLLVGGERGVSCYTIQL